MRLQKIASLENRLSIYRRERFQFFTREAPLMVGGAAVLISLLLYLLDRYSPNGFQNWEWVSVGLVVCISAPALLSLKPKRPTEDDVLADQFLRRAHGLDDTVES